MRKTAYFSLLKRDPLNLSDRPLLTFTVLLLMDKILKLIELIAGGVNFSPDSDASPLYFPLLSWYSPFRWLCSWERFSPSGGYPEIVKSPPLKASGMSLYQLYFPIAILSISAYLFTSFLVFYGLPWGNRGFINTFYVILKSKSRYRYQGTRL